MGELRRSLGLGALTFYGVGVILGAGIYSILGEAAGIAGEALWWSFLLASLAALLTGLSYAELATMFPQAGAEYVYLRAAWPEGVVAAKHAGLGAGGDGCRHDGDRGTGLRRVCRAVRPVPARGRSPRRW